MTIVPGISEEVESVSLQRGRSRRETRANLDRKHCSIDREDGPSTRRYRTVACGVSSSECGGYSNLRSCRECRRGSGSLYSSFVHTQLKSVSYTQPPSIQGNRPPIDGLYSRAIEGRRLPQRENSVRPSTVGNDLSSAGSYGAATRIWVDGVETLIPAMEFMLLRFLAERHGEIVTREELVSAGWGERVTVPSNSLNVHLTRLRRQIPAGLR